MAIDKLQKQTNINIQKNKPYLGNCYSFVW